MVRWDAYAAWTLKNIESFSSIEEVINFAQTRHGFELRECDDLHDSIAKWEKKVKLEFPHYSSYFEHFSEPPYLSNNTVINYNGRLMSSMICHLIRFHFAVLSWCSLSSTICEIGGGYGAPARLWMTSCIFRPQTYIIIDLAESLFFSECYLRNEFLNNPDIDIINLATQDEPSDIKVERQKIILCPTEKIDFLSKIDIDLVINTLSMQEMSEEWVDFYMNWLDQTKAKNFYSFNACRTPINKMHEVSNVHSPRPSQQWIARIASFPYEEGPAAEIVYDRIINLPSLKSQMKEKEEKVAKQFFLSLEERNDYVKLVELLRQLDSKELIFNFVSLFFNTSEPIPKETVYFCDLLLKEKNMIEEHRKMIIALKSHLDKVRQSGKEAVVDAFVDI